VSIAVPHAVTAIQQILRIAVKPQDLAAR